MRFLNSYIFFPLKFIVTVDIYSKWTLLRMLIINHDYKWRNLLSKFDRLQPVLNLKTIR